MPKVEVLSFSQWVRRNHPEGSYGEKRAQYREYLANVSSVQEHLSKQAQPVTEAGPLQPVCSDGLLRIAELGRSIVQQKRRFG